MAFLLAPVAGLFGAGGGAAAATGLAASALPMAGLAPVAMAGAFPAAPIAAAGAAIGGGLSISSILQGGASVLGLVSSIAAGAADKERADAEAADADAEQSLETLKGIDRRRSLKLAAAEAVGELDAAYAASGVDLSFGTAQQARREAFRETDLGLTSDSTTTMSRLSRLSERAANYRRMGKRALAAGVIGGLSGALSSGASIFGRY